MLQERESHLTFCKRERTETNSSSQDHIFHQSQLDLHRATKLDVAIGSSSGVGDEGRRQIDERPAIVEKRGLIPNFRR